MRSSYVTQLLFISTTYPSYLTNVHNVTLHVPSYPVLEKSLSHQLQQAILHHAIPLPPSHPPINTIQLLIETFFHTLINIHDSGNSSDNTTHISHIGPITYIKIKSHQLTPLGQPRFSTQSSPCLALSYAYHWADQTSELPYSAEHIHWFLLQWSLHRIRKPLYTHPFTFYYSMCPIDTDVPSFIHHTYQYELLPQLASRSEIVWFAYYYRNLLAPNYTIGYTGTIRNLTTHLAHIYTQHLYTNSNTRNKCFAKIHAKNQPLHTPPSKTPPVTSTMKICPFCFPQHLIGIPLHDDCIHLYVHCTNSYLIIIRQQASIGFLAP